MTAPTHEPTATPTPDAAALILAAFRAVRAEEAAYWRWLRGELPRAEVSRRRDETAQAQTAMWRVVDGWAS